MAMNYAAFFWIGLALLLSVAFLYKVFVRLRRIKYNKHHIPEIKTRNKRLKFLLRFKYLEGVGD